MSDPSWDAMFAASFGDVRERQSETAKAAFGMTLDEAKATLRRDGATAIAIAVATGILAASSDPDDRAMARELTEIIQT